MKATFAPTPCASTLLTLYSVNRPFFDACDAMWVNYTWRRRTPSALRKEVGRREHPPAPGLPPTACSTPRSRGGTCAVQTLTWLYRIRVAGLVQAGPRAADVYMGVDCFGRGTYGGGGFRCDVALRACLAQGLSGEGGRRGPVAG